MKYFKIFLLLCSTIAFSQDYKTLWSETIQDELDGKTESAYKKVQNIYTLAKKQDNEEQIIKCFFYISKFRQTFDEKSQVTIIKQLREEIATAKPVAKAILNYVYGKILMDFSSYHYYNIQKISTVQGVLSPEIATWSLDNFTNEINKTFTEVFANKELLHQTPINNYREILEIPAYVDGKNYTLYELLCNEITKEYSQRLSHYTYRKDLPFTAEQIEKLYSQTNLFVTVKDNTYTISFQNFLNILQSKEDFELKNNPASIDASYYKRLEIIDGLFHMPHLLFPTLDALEKETKNQTLRNELYLKRVKRIATLSNKNDNPNALKEVVAQLNEIIKSNPNEYTTAEAQLEKENILNKFLHIQLNRVNYEGENTRAHIDFKNIDQLKVNYYKLSLKDYLRLFNNYKDRELEIEKHIQNKKPFLETVKSLGNPKNHYQYSTEILMNKLPLGYYIISFEDTDKEANTQLDKNYSFYQVTNITYVDDENDSHDLYYLLDRKTGKPLTDAYLVNKEKKIKADALGKISYPKASKDSKNTLETYLVHEKDSIAFNYSVPLKYDSKDDEDEDFKAKAMLYLDRAIYRPGQKVYFKGIVFQDKNNKKSVVPFVTVHLTVDDASNETIKEFDLQTNEFGSFSGEFDIPKNCMTGEFSIEIEEPEEKFLAQDKKYYNKKEEEHAFWENVDFENNNFEFKVEEYKRPTFEITIDKLKEAYRLGDSVVLTGYAKTLAGSNLTHATVKYSITRSYYTNDYKSSNDKNYIQKEITTDTEGTFSIPLHFTVNDVKDDLLRDMSFTIAIDVTDTNGETRSKSHSIVVYPNTLKIKTKNLYNAFEEDQNNFNVEITNLDEHPIPYQGKIAIYKKERNYHLKPRAFQTPEIQNISEDTFKKLFPHEPYKDDTLNGLTLIDSLVFDTKNGNDIVLPKLTKGYYKTVTSLVDTKGTPVKEENHFEIKSKLNPSTEERLFVYKRINYDDDKQIHLEINTSIPDLYITTRFYCGKNIVEEKITLIKNGKGMVSFDKLKNPKYDYSFFFSTQWENMGYAQNVTLAKEAKTRKFDFEVVSFRSKIEPGSKENWSFKLTNNKLETEVLASMYDTTLDLFAKENWKKPSFYSYASPDYPNVSNYNTEDVYFASRTRKKIYYHKISFAPQFQWFGFSFTNPKNNYIQKQYEQSVAQQQVIRLGTKTVTGTASDSNGPLPGVNVVVKDTQIGVSTGFDGSYSINVKEGEILVFSFLGMRDVSKTVGTSNVINTVLQDESKKLSEVVVSAFGITKKEGAYNPNIIVVTSNNKDLSYFKKYRKQLFEDEENESRVVKKSLAYSVTNVESVVIRGSSSLKENEKALLVIDGEIRDNLNVDAVSQDDITSITILKDKEATALYGSKGANGVIIITTKNAMKALSDVKTRTNFNETAFFYPHITTDSKGKFAFNFTTPESLTQWKLRLLGHDKESNIGTFETEIISQKDVMVMPNMPRFVRETDTLTLSSKVVNLTAEAKSGNAVLQLFDAVTGNPIDAVCLNSNNIKTFNCKAKESIALEWKITIPEGIQGLQYKVIAKSGNFSDGEENMLPVLSNKILVTEALPIWVRENTKKEFVFENLKNNDSKTLKNQSFTFEYTSNPTWLAIQSLPYLIEFEHECAEQTFARFYANTLASKIIDSQPKIAEVFDKWRKEPNKKSKLEMNEELKSIVLRETPWFLEADETEKNRRVATLFDLQKLKENSASALKKLEEKQKNSGGFAWFDGGQENYYVTQHILSGIGHLNKMFPSNDLNTITEKGIPFIDTKFIANTQTQRKEKRPITNTELQYLYSRSFYTKQYPIVNDSLKKAIQYQIQQTKTHWLSLGLGQKAMLALSAKRFGDSVYAKKIVTHLKETAIKDAEKGMYWIENKKGYYWFDAPIENQALLIETFAEIEHDPILINNLKAWLIHQKQREHWGTTKATTEAVYALLSNGIKVVEQKNMTNFSIGDTQLLNKKLASANTETATGYFKLQWKPEEITKELATITIENKNDLPHFGGAYWQYFEHLENIKSNANTTLQIKKEVYKKIKDANGERLISLNETSLNVGDKVSIRLEISSNTDLEFVHLKDLRASCMEPIDVISTYKNSSGLGYYMSTKDTATHFFFDNIKQGTYVLEYELRVNNLGVFNNGIVTLQSMYAPEFSTHSSSQKISITK